MFDAEAPVPINALGYRGPVPAAPRPAGLLRVAVMGDSVAFGSGTAWPEILSVSLVAHGTPVEVLNFAVPGYTLVQGMRQFEDEVAKLAPDVVLIAYGWNDHWLARAGVPDGALRAPGKHAARVALFLGRFRIAQALRAVLTTPATPGTTRRVPLEAYRDDLTRFVERVRAAGGAPIVVGLPSALTEADLPEYLIDGRFTPSAAEAIADHARYLDAARDAGAPYVDAPAAFAGDPALFTRDRIHLSAEGHRRMAELVLPPVLQAAP